MKIISINMKIVLKKIESVETFVENVSTLDIDNNKY